MKKLVAGLLLLSSMLFAVSTNNILALSWENTYCKFHPTKKECQRRSVYSLENFTIHGLWPKNRNKCHTKYKFKLSKMLKNTLVKYMPAAPYGLAKHEWFKHGTCLGADSETYFITAIKFTQQFNETNFVNYLHSHVGQYISLARLRFLFAGTFGGKNARKFQLICKKGYIAEIRIPLKGNPVENGLYELMNNAKPMLGVKQCQGGIITNP